MVSKMTSRWLVSHGSGAWRELDWRGDGQVASTHSDGGHVPDYGEL